MCCIAEDLRFVEGWVAAAMEPADSAGLWQKKAEHGVM